MNNVEYLKARVDLVTYVQSCVPSLRKEGRLFVACCPFHSEKHASFKVDPEKQIVTCFGGCGKTWDLISFAETYHRVDFQGALEILAQYSGIELVSHGKQEPHSHKRLYALLECAEQWFRFRLNPDVIDYLIKARGLTPETIADAGIGYAPNTWQSLYTWLAQQGYTDKEMLDAGVCARSEKTEKLYDFFRGRVMIPMRDTKGRVVGFSGRAFDEGVEPRYKNSPQSEIFDKGRLIYTPMSRAKNTQGKAHPVCIVVEGHMDAISALNRGFDNVKACMGTSLTKEQLDLLSKGGTEKIIFCLDNDDAGQKAMHRLAKEHVHTAAHLGVDLLIMRPPHGKDADDTFREHPELWQSAVDAARPVVDVLIDLELSPLPSDASAVQKTNAARKLVPMLKHDNRIVEKENFGKLAARLDLSDDEMERLVRPQLTILHSAPPMPKQETYGVPTTEEWVLHGILCNEADGWLARANACLFIASDSPMPYALAPLNEQDFTDPHLRRFFAVSIKAQAAEEMIKGHIDASLERVYERIKGLQAIGQEFGLSFDYDVFIDRVYALRLDRLRKERPTYEAKDPMKARECAIGIACLQLAQEDLVI